MISDDRALELCEHALHFLRTNAHSRALSGLSSEDIRETLERVSALRTRSGRTRSGVLITEALIEDASARAERGFEVSRLRPRLDVRLAVLAESAAAVLELATLAEGVARQNELAEEWHDAAAQHHASARLIEAAQKILDLAGP